MYFTSNNSSPTTHQMCSLTAKDLDRHLRESGHGANQNIFNCYFIPNSMPPRCIACQRLIAEHPSSSSQGPNNTNHNSASNMNNGKKKNKKRNQKDSASNESSIQQSSSNTIRVSYLGNNNDNTSSEHQYRPEISSREGSIDKLVDPFLSGFCYVGSLFLLVAVILFIVFGATYDSSDESSGIKFVGPAVCTILGVIFTLIASRAVTTIDKEARQISYSYSKFPWICCGKSFTFPFSDVGGIEIRETNIRMGRSYQWKIFLQIRSREALEVGMHGGLDVKKYAEGWENYLRECGCTFNTAVVL